VKIKREREEEERGLEEGVREKITKENSIVESHWHDSRH